MVTRKSLVPWIASLVLAVGCSIKKGPSVSGERNCLPVADATSPSKEVCYQVIDGNAVIEGDIVLGNAEALQANRARSGVALAIGSHARWPGGVIPYTVSPTFPNPQRITDAVNHWIANTVIRLRPRSNETDYLTFQETSNAGSCYSAIGRAGLQHLTVLGSYCTAGNVIHEIGHVAGLWHEQAREDRDQYVLIVTKNIDQSNPNTIYQFDRQVQFGQDIGPYDFGSIMHYPPYAFAMLTASGVPVGPTITKLDGSISGFGQRDGLSAGDISTIAKIYSPDFIENPSDFRVDSASSTSLRLYFTDNADNEDGYKAELALSPAGPWIVRDLPPVPRSGSQVSMVIDGLNRNTAYYVRLRAYRGSSYSDYTPQIDWRTGPPPAPVSLSATTISAAEIQLSWSDLGAFDDGYRIERMPAGGTTWSILATVAQRGAGSYSDQTVHENNRYVYRVRLYDGAGFSAPSPNAPAVAQILPAAPTNLTAKVVSSSRIDIAWTDASNNETGFKVLRSIDVGAFQLVKTLSAGATSWSNTGLRAGHVYLYIVRAYNIAGESDNRNIAQGYIP